MRLTIKQDKSIEIGTAELRCNQITSEVKRIQSYAEQLSHTIHAKNEQGTYEGCIVNISYVTSIHLLLNRNLELRLDNDEKLIVSRRYVKAFQTLLEMR